MLGAVTLCHVDDRLHGRAELVHVAYVGEIPASLATQGFRRHPIKQDQTEIAVGPPCGFASVEFLPAKFE